MLTVSNNIIPVYFKNSRGIRGAVRILGIPISRVCRLVLTYKLQRGIR